MTTEAPDKAERYLSSTFAVSPAKLEGQGRSLNLLLLHRRCASCWGSLMQEAAGGLEIPWEDHLEKIAGHCSKSKEYITSGLPIMEAVFRVILSAGNEAVSLEQIIETLQERWSDSANHWVPPPPKLYRMVSRDVFYGIGEVTPPAAPQA